MEWPEDEFPMDRCISVYRCCFLLNNLSSKAFGKVFIPGVKVITILLITFPAFGLIIFWHQLDSLSIVLALAAVIACLSSIWLSAVILSKIYEFSSKFKHNVSKHILAHNGSKRRQI
jgi:hypothetical protein